MQLKWAAAHQNPCHGADLRCTDPAQSKQGRCDPSPSPTPLAFSLLAGRPCDDVRLFSLGLPTAFFVSSLVLLNYVRQLNLRYLRQEGADSMAGLRTAEGAVFALIGLLLVLSSALTNGDS